MAEEGGGRVAGGKGRGGGGWSSLCVCVLERLEGLGEEGKGGGGVSCVHFACGCCVCL